jgi:hypothetical protein
MAIKRSLTQGALVRFESYVSRTRIAAASGLRGALGGLGVLECDLLIIAGDICPVESQTRREQEGWRSFVPETFQKI